MLGKEVIKMFQHHREAVRYNLESTAPSESSQRVELLIDDIQRHMSLLTDLVEFRHGPGVHLLRDPLDGKSLEKLRNDQEELVNLLRDAIDRVLGNPITG